jgi:Zn-dependent peptidase ImmA (M78 family)
MGKQFTPDQKAQFKAQKESEAKDLVEQMKRGVEALIGSNAWVQFLAFQAMFWKYSWTNQLLIHLQRPGASRVMGRRQWETRTGRRVKASEKKIAIRAPIFGWGKRTEDGQEKPYRFVRFFKTVFVYDIAQTEGPDLPELDVIQTLDGSSPAADLAFTALSNLAQKKGYTIETERMIDGMGGYVVFSEKRIALNEANSPAQQAKTLAHELAHVILHSKESGLCHTPTDYREVEAESVAYCVMSALGVDSASYSFGYVAHWSGSDPEKVEKVADRVQKATAEILTFVEEQAPKPAKDKKASEMTLAEMKAEIERLKAENACLMAA